MRGKSCNSCSIPHISGSSSIWRIALWYWFTTPIRVVGVVLWFCLVVFFPVIWLLFVRVLSFGGFPGIVFGLLFCLLVIIGNGTGTVTVVVVVVLILLIISSRYPGNSRGIVVVIVLVLIIPVLVVVVAVVVIVSYPGWIRRWVATGPIYKGKVFHREVSYRSQLGFCLTVMNQNNFIPFCRISIIRIIYKRMLLLFMDSWEICLF